MSSRRGGERGAGVLELGAVMGEKSGFRRIEQVFPYDKAFPPHRVRCSIPSDCKDTSNVKCVDLLPARSGMPTSGSAQRGNFCALDPRSLVADLEQRARRQARVDANHVRHLWQANAGPSGEDERRSQRGTTTRQGRAFIGLSLPTSGSSWEWRPAERCVRVTIRREARTATCANRPSAPSCRGASTTPFPSTRDPLSHRTASS